MSGRYSSRGNFGGRGGRIFKSNNNDGRRKASTKKTLQDFTFYFCSVKQASNYKNTVLFVINHVKKDFNRGNNIAEALRKLEYENTDNWNPILKAITSSDEYLKEDKIDSLDYSLKWIMENPKNVRCSINRTNKGIWTHLGKMRDGHEVEY